jgi:type IV secretion system protein VirB10
MSPDASPRRVPPQAGVRRVNDLPAYIVVTLMGIFLVMMALVAMDRSTKQNQGTSARDEKADSASRYASEIVGARKDGFIQPEKPAPPDIPVLAPPQPEPIPIARPENLDLPPAPPRGSQPQAAQREEEERHRIRMTKLQMLEEGVKAKTGVSVAAPRSAASSSPPAGVPATRQDALAQLAAVRQQIDAQGRDNPTAAYQARLHQLQAPGSANGPAEDSRIAPTLMQRAASSPGGSKDVSQFAGPGQEDRWKLDAQPEAPRSPYELRAGFVVPATLISGINSDLPGQIMAQVSQDVYDTATGRWKLIPQGARLVGRYSSDVAYGQARVLVAWQRIVFPDGKAMDIGAMPGADSAGFAGFNDEVNNHYVRLFAGAFLMSGVTAGIALSQDRGAGVFGGRPTASSALSEALGQQLGQVTAQLISRNLSIAPTLEIRPGYRFNVVVTKDMTFSKPYKAFDY